MYLHVYVTLHVYMYLHVYVPLHVYMYLHVHVSTLCAYDITGKHIQYAFNYAFKLHQTFK